MTPFRVALAQFDAQLADLEANRERHLAWCRRAAAEHADMIVFPELSLTGYHLRERIPTCALPLDSPFWREFKEVSREIAVVVGGVLEAPGPLFYNAAFVFSGGELIHVHKKSYLPDYRIFEEGKWFARGRGWRTFSLGGRRFGILICEESWHLMPAYIFFVQHVDAILILANSVQTVADLSAADSPATAVRLQNRFYARMLNSYVAFVNRVGEEEGRTFWGGSEAVSPTGETLVEGGTDGEALEVFVIDPELLRKQRFHTPLRRDEDLPLVLAELQRLYRQEPAGDASEQQPGATKSGAQAQNSF